MNQEQINQILKGQEAMSEGINKLLALFTLEPLNDATNPILNLTEAAKLLGTTSGQLKKACLDKEVPHRMIGSKYIFSRVALMAWLHNVNMSYLFERMENYKKHYKERFQDKDASMVLENWVRFTINPISGANEEFHLRYFEPKKEAPTLNTEEAAELMNVSAGKVREWARGFLYHKIPIIRDGSSFKFPKDELEEWMKTPIFLKMKQDYLTNSELNKQRLIAAEKRREKERLEKEEKKRQRLLKKQLKSNN